MNNHSQDPPKEDTTPAREKRRFDTMTDALKAGKEEGAAKAREKGPALKSGISDAAHDLAYGLAYGSVFAGAFLNELIPGSIRSGLSKGASAGKEAGQRVCQKLADGLNADSERVVGEKATNSSFS